VEILPASEDDATAIVDIFNHYVEHSFASYFKTKVGPEFAGRLMALGARYAFVSAKDDAGNVVGFGLLHPYHPGDTFERTAEVSYFLHPECRRQGIGSKVLMQLTEQARRLEIHTLLASISSRNEESLAFHRKHGFDEVARLPGIGEKFGEAFDVVYMQKRI
jgi:phosphinothricin acetyltransferase